MSLLIIDVCKWLEAVDKIKKSSDVSSDDLQLNIARDEP